MSIIGEKMLPVVSCQLPVLPLPATGKPLLGTALQLRRGFTLVEIVVVLVIISAMLTMTVVSLSGGTAGVAARESTTRLLTAIRYARYYAAVHGCQCRVTFSPQNNAYALTYRSDPDKDEFDTLPGGRSDRLNAPAHFSAIVIQPRESESEPGAASDSESEDQQVITFEPTGECDGARIEITDGRVIYTLVVSPYSGLVRLYKGPLGDIPSDREDLDA